MITEEDLTGAFFASLLFTRDAGLAQAAVEEATPCSRSLPVLLRAVMEASLAPRPVAAVAFEEALSLVPPELQRVLRLPTRLRQSFVLRVLLQWPVEVCATLLQLTVEQTERYVCTAFTDLQKGSTSWIDLKENGLSLPAVPLALDSLQRISF